MDCEIRIRSQYTRKSNEQLPENEQIHGERKCS